MHPFVKAFMLLWFSLVPVIMALIVISFITGFPEGDSVVGLVTTTGLAIFGVALVKTGWWLGRNERTAIVVFLKSTLEANDAA